MSILIGWYYGKKGYLFKNKTQFKNSVLGSSYIKNTMNNNVNKLPIIPSNKYWFIPFHEINKWNLGNVTKAITTTSSSGSSNCHSSHVSPCDNDSPVAIPNHIDSTSNWRLSGFMVILQYSITTLIALACIVEISDTVLRFL